MDMYSNTRPKYGLQQKCSGEYVYNMEGIFVQGNMPVMWNRYTSGPGHTLHCSEFIWGLYTDVVVSYQHMK